MLGCVWSNGDNVLELCDMMAEWGWDIKVRTCKCREWVPGRWAVVTGDWRLETGGGESWVSDNTHGDISETEKMLVHVMWLELEKRKMTMDAFIQWWFKSDQYQSKVSKIGFQSWGLTKRLIKPLDFETNNQSKVNPSYFLISFISDCKYNVLTCGVAWSIWWQSEGEN